MACSAALCTLPHTRGRSQDAPSCLPLLRVTALPRRLRGGFSHTRCNVFKLSLPSTPTLTPCLLKALRARPVTPQLPCPPGLKPASGTGKGLCIIRAYPPPSAEQTQLPGGRASCGPCRGLGGPQGHVWAEARVQEGCGLTWASSVGSWATIPPAPTVTGDTQPGVGEKDDALRGRRTPCRKQAGRAHTPGRPSQAGHPASVPFNPPNTLKAGTTSTRPVSRMRKLRPKERSHSPTTAQLGPEHIRAHVLVAFQARAQTPVHAPAPAGWGATAPLPPPRPHSWVRVGPRPHQVPQLHPTPRMLAPRPTG